MYSADVSRDPARESLPPLDASRILAADRETAAKLSPDQIAFLVHEMKRIAINGRAWPYSARVARETLLNLGDKEIQQWPDKT